MKKGLNSEAVKIIALVTMLIDHIGFILYGHIDTGVYNVLRGIGRISFPLFAFLIAEGFFYTRDDKKYILRIIIFAFLSEIPFNMMTGGKVINTGSVNVLFTFTIALLVLYVCRDYDKKGQGFGVIHFLTLVAGMALAFLIKSDYSYCGVALVFVFYYMRYKKGTGYYFTAALIMVLYGESISSLAAVFSLIFIYLYNGERGRYGNGMKWFFYAFYPVHMMILGIIGRFL